MLRSIALRSSIIISFAMPKSKQILKEKFKKKPWTTWSRVLSNDVDKEKYEKMQDFKRRPVRLLPLTRILLIAATISTRLLGRATSRLPMY